MINKPLLVLILEDILKADAGQKLYKLLQLRLVMKHS